MSKFALPCVKCGKPLKNVNDGSDNQPYGGTEFQTIGHYGSTIHDELGTEVHKALWLIVNICDTCILRAIDAGVIQSRTNYHEGSSAIALSRHPISSELRAWVLAQNEKEYGSAWGEDTPVDYEAEMRKAGWENEL